VLRDLSHEVGLRDCADSTPIHYSDQLDLLASARTPLCLRGELGSCPAPCAGLCHSTEYGRRVGLAVDFLEGKSDDPIPGLIRRMESAAERQEFEQAARFRDRIDRLKDLRRTVREFGAYLRTLRFIYYVPGTVRQDDRRYLIVGGRVRQTLPGSHTLEPEKAPAAGGGEGDHPPSSPLPLASQAEQAMIQVLLQEPEPPPDALSAQDREELFLVSRWFRRHPEELERTLPLPPCGRALPHAS